MCYIKLDPETFGGEGMFYHLHHIGKSLIDHALLDLGARFNLMPHSFLEKIGCLNLKPTNMTLQFTDGSKKKALWKVVNVTIKVNHLTFITNFFVMDIEEAQQVPNLLGRSFMRTAHVTINFSNGVYTLREGKKQMFFYIHNIEDFPNESTHR